MVTPFVKKIFIFAGLVALIVWGRLADHPANFAPVTAVALVAGVYLGRNYAAATVLLGMLLSDWQIQYA